jgi:arylsulfatase A-like enzyme
MEFFENDTWGQGNSVFSDYSYQVPLLMYHPRWSDSKIISQIVRSVDVMPTLLEILGIDYEENYDGQSLLSMIHNDAQLNLEVFAETGVWFSRPPGMKEGHLHYPELLDVIDVSQVEDGTIILKEAFKDRIYRAKDNMLICGQWKLVRQPMESGDCFLLFDRYQDPQNQHDLASQHPELLAELQSKLLQACCTSH